MKNCISCGKEISDSAKFCHECGTPVMEEKLCYNCACVLEGGAKFCQECGVAVLQNEENIPLEEAQPTPIFQALCCEAPTASPMPNQVAGGKVSKTNYILAFAFAVVSLACATYCIKDVLSTLFLFLPSMIVFLALSRGFERKYYNQTNEKNGFIKAAGILTKIALPVGIAFACISFVSDVISFFTSPVWEAIVKEIAILVDELLYEVETELLYEIGISK